jgi:hypothetical protein
VGTFVKIMSGGSEFQRTKHLYLLLLEKHTSFHLSAVANRKGVCCRV